jgi:hypothetical protein
LIGDEADVEPAANEVVDGGADIGGALLLADVNVELLEDSLFKPGRVVAGRVVGALLLLVLERTEGTDMAATGEEAVVLFVDVELLKASCASDDCCIVFIDNEVERDGRVVVAVEVGVVDDDEAAAAAVIAAFEDGLMGDSRVCLLLS